jgi:hypothetical protein
MTPTNGKSTRTAKSAESGKATAAVDVLEQERGRAWTRRRDYVSALDDINTLAKQRKVCATT